MLAELVKNSQKPKVVTPSKFQYELEYNLPNFSNNLNSSVILIILVHLINGTGY